MANAHSALVQHGGGPAPRSLLRLMVVALVVALGFDALSTALVWDLVQALGGTVKRASVHAVRPTDVRESSRRQDAPAASSRTP